MPDQLAALLGGQGRRFRFDLLETHKIEATISFRLVQRPWTHPFTGSGAREQATLWVAPRSRDVGNRNVRSPPGFPPLVKLQNDSDDEHREHPTHCRTDELLNVHCNQRIRHVDVAHKYIVAPPRHPAQSDASTDLKRPSARHATQQRIKTT